MIKIYTSTLNCVAVITQTVSIEWNLRFYDYGSFVINLPINCPDLKHLVINNYVFNNGNIGIILYREQKKDSIEVRGYDLKGITSFRACQGTRTGNVETVIKGYATAELATGNKAIPKLIIRTNINRGSNITKAVEIEKFDKVLNEICIENQIGYDIKKENDNLVFDIAVPTDRSNSIIFSRRFKNISDFLYIQDDYDTINTIYNKSDTITEHCSTVYTGTERREGISNYTDTSEVVKDLINTKGSISAEALYRNGWYLGDYVQVVVEAFGEILSVKLQITEVKEVYEQGNTSIVPVFGEKKESVIKRLIKGVKA